MKICRTFAFSAGHFLPKVPTGHKCGRMHGHNYVLEIEISGRQCPTLGWLMDFAQIDVIVKDLVIRFLDHVVLNEVPGLENPTSEVLVNWIWDRLSIYGWRDGLTLSRVRVSETPTSWAERVPYES